MEKVLEYLAYGKYPLEIFLLWLLADFLTGAVHWWEDAYGNPTWPVLGKYIVIPNLEHHRNPDSLTKGSYWHRIDTSAIAAVVIAGVLWIAGWHSWQMVLCFLFASQANEIHAASHRTDAENGKIIAFLQRTGIFQGKESHDWHHAAPYDTNFCVMTEFLNPILNRIHFWSRIEKGIRILFGIPILRGSDIRGGI